MEDEDSSEKRRQRSEEARRAALKQKTQQQKERDRQIAADLANVDKKATKRIVFDDSEGDDCVEETVDGEKKSSSNSSKRPKLFDSGDESEQEDGSAFDIKNRHSGPKGEQLMKMESRFNSDPRFKLNDKFAESDSDDDEHEEGSSEKKEMKMEKDKNRELLSKILGKSVEEKKPKTTETATLKARPFTRFDPENPEHLAWMKEFEASKNPQKAAKNNEVEAKSQDSGDEGDEKKEKDEDKKVEEVEDDVGSGDEVFEKADIFFKMDEGFSKEMKERKETGDSSTASFSFLSMMGRKYNAVMDDEEEETTTVNKKKQEKIEHGKEVTKEKIEHVEKALLKVKVTTKFFVDPLTDEKIKSLASNFRRTQTVDKVIDKWAPHRDAIFKLWKKQRRDAVKKQKESFFTNGKRKRKVEEENGESNVNA